jgi:hypothetical protein
VKIIRRADAMQGIHDAMRKAVAGFLRPGETVQVVFGAVASNQFSSALNHELGIEGNRLRLVAVTTSRILVFNATSPTWTGVWGVVAELPRSTRLGPPGGLLYHVITAGKEKLRVHRSFFTDIRAADAMSAEG